MVATNTQPPVLEDTHFLSDLTNVNPPEKNKSHELFDKAMISAVKEMQSDPDFMKSIQDHLASSSASEESFDLVPLSGFVLKTNLSKPTSIYPEQLKVFVNLCHSPYVPAPPLASDEEIRRSIEGANKGNEGWKVPMSLIGPKDDMDKVGRPCIVFDACVHSDVLTKTGKDPDFKLFILELAMEWIEEKHSMSLSRDFSLPKMKFKGVLSAHKIYRPKRPAMQTVPKTQPRYFLERGDSLYILQVQLPLLSNAQLLLIDIEKDQVILDHPSYTLNLPLPLPISINHPEIDACFDRRKKKLTLHLPLL
ncbi:PIH1 domain-containing protein 1 [Coelomomyces lativittatus]|nr:PIH1 domain-containing protein 1 [Coelomomyces lativittatus]KAJ1511781.1 PIH1 domain-containing protein 1 [Coelomomyces lativittatus]KAJ1518474.1 PIH1 domain-containing protein 1 [Coelomomyces lativittatus]